jgi:hypothetical protein
VSYSLQIGVRYLRSKKRATVSMITLISIIGVALGVAALLAVLSITTGFEKAFRDKVLGVNAHVLVLKYGREFRDYRDVLATVGDMPEVAGIAPFSINEMMLTKGERRAVVLVKGVTPKGLRTVLDLPQQMVAGDLKGLRRPGSLPTPTTQPQPDEDWQWLRNLRDGKPQKGDSPLFERVKNGDESEGEVGQTGESPRVDEEPTRLMRSQLGGRRFGKRKRNGARRNERPNGERVGPTSGRWPNRATSRRCSGVSMTTSSRCRMTPSGKPASPRGRRRSRWTRCPESSSGKRSPRTSASKLATA